MSVALRRSRSDRPRGRGLGSASQQAPLAQRADHREEQRDEEDPYGSRGEHPEEHARADRVAARSAGATRCEQRRHAENERKRGHEDRPQPLAARFERRLADGPALGPQLVRELDDQDRVLRGEANYDNEADLLIYVVRHAAQPDAEQGAKGAERHAQQHRQRDRPALVLRRQHQEHHHEAEPEHEPDLSARPPPSDPPPRTYSRPMSSGLWRYLGCASACTRYVLPYRLKSLM